MNEKNDVTLREYMDSQIQWLDRHVASKLIEINRAVDKADDRMRADFVSREEYKRDVENRKDDKRANIALVLSMLAIVANIVLMILFNLD